MYTTNIIPVEQRIKEYKEEALNNKKIRQNKENRKITNFFSRFFN